jgi:hypothetical protein
MREVVELRDSGGDGAVASFNTDHKKLGRFLLEVSTEKRILGFTAGGGFADRCPGHKSGR